MDKKVFDYKIVTGATAKYLSEVIMDYIRTREWELYGSPFYANGLFYQAIILIK